MKFVCGCDFYKRQIVRSSSRDLLKKIIDLSLEWVNPDISK